MKRERQAWPGFLYIPDMHKVSGWLENLFASGVNAYYYWPERDDEWSQVCEKTDVTIESFLLFVLMFLNYGPGVDSHYLQCFHVNVFLTTTSQLYMLPVVHKCPTVAMIIPQEY